MKNGLKIITQIVEELQILEGEKKELDYNQFVDLIYRKKLEKEQSNSSSHNFGELHFFINTISRSFKNQLTSLLKTWPISSYDEFSYLAHIQYLGSVRKMELAQMHFMSTTSGFEIIQKLLKSDFVTEFPDPDDKRASRIKLTPAGVNLLNELSPLVNQFLEERYNTVENIEEVISSLKVLIK